MNWLDDNWGWLVAGAVGVAVVYVISKVAEKRKKRAQAKQVLEFIVGLMHTFEAIIAETVGDVYNRENRQKIAAGMMIIVMSDTVPLERLREKAVFEMVLIKAIKMLTESHELPQVH